MDWVHIHLALNHISVIGMPFLLVLIGWGLVRRDLGLTRLALWWIAIFSGLSIVLKFTGDFAAEQDQARLQPVAEWVERHEQSADQATTAVFVFGLAAVAVLYLGRASRRVPAWAYTALVTIGVLTCLLLARTANMGGQISHPELR